MWNRWLNLVGVTLGVIVILATDMGIELSFSAMIIDAFVVGSVLMWGWTVARRQWKRKYMPERYPEKRPAIVVRKRHD